MMPRRAPYTRDELITVLERRRRHAAAEADPIIDRVGAIDTALHALRTDTPIEPCGLELILDGLALDDHTPDA